MNSIHNLLCSSDWWARRVRDRLVPWGTEGLELGEDVLEIGPGFGATTRYLASRLGPGHLTALELDEGYCRHLRRELDGSAEIVQGDATALPFDDNRFSAVLCFTMLHHIPRREQQDRAFAEIARVLRAGGLFAGTDSVGTGAVFKLIHLGDTLLPIDPEEMASRLGRAGLMEPDVEGNGKSFRFRACKGG